MIPVAVILPLLKKLALLLMKKPLHMILAITQGGIYMWFAIGTVVVLDNLEEALAALDSQSPRPFLDAVFDTFASADQRIFDGTQAIIEAGMSPAAYGSGVFDIALGILYIAFFIMMVDFFINDVGKAGLATPFVLPLALIILYLGMLAFEHEPFKGLFELVDNIRLLMEGYQQNYVDGNRTLTGDALNSLLGEHSFFDNSTYIENQNGYNSTNMDNSTGSN